MASGPSNLVTNCTDQAVRGTNDDVTRCKNFAVTLGYWKDPYIQHFCRKRGERKPPEINRGYYARVKGVHFLLTEFIKKVPNNEWQLISLGAGYDTLFWRLKDEGICVKNFVEVDFPEVTSRKAATIKATPKLLEFLATGEGEVVIHGSDLHSENYHLIGTDLKSLKSLCQKLHSCNLDKNIPTVILAECVLVYLPPADSDAILKWLSETFKTAFFINYEQVKMDDKFGATMIANLRYQQCELPGLAHCASLDTQEMRFIKQGWSGATAADMMIVYNNLPGEDLHRIEHLELLDEREVMEQLFRHYCLTWAYKDGSDIGLAQIAF